jgi:hypothetical protein
MLLVSPAKDILSTFLGPLYEDAASAVLVMWAGPEERIVNTV